MDRVAIVIVVIALAGCGTGAAVPASQATPLIEAPSGQATPSAARPTGSTTDMPMASIEPATLTGRIAFSAGPPHGEDIWLVGASGANLERVTTDPTADFDPSWSPDGRRLAYRHQTGDDRTSEIWVIGTDGSGAHDVSAMPDSADWGPAWSPDGRLIAWNSQHDLGAGFELALASPDDGAVRFVAAGRWVEYPAWSPDGTRVAFMSQQPGSFGTDPNYDVYVAGVDGTGLTQLTDSPGTDGFPTWSPDGAWIAFASTRDDCRNSAPDGCLRTGDLGPYYTLYVMRPDGTDQRRVSRRMGRIADWSPDGRYLVTEGSGALEIIAVDGTAVARISVTGGFAGFPDWLP